MPNKLLLTLFLFLSSFSVVLAQANHDFRHELYDQRNDSPQQQKFRKIAPMPAGVVYIQRPGEGELEIRAHFRQMKDLGFTNLKQIMALPDWTDEQIQLIALEEGIIPWWYGEGGWEPITDALLKQLGLSKLSIEEVRRHPKMIAHQNEVLRQRIERIIARKKKRVNELSRGAAPPMIQRWGRGDLS